ncbi:MAG: T9SS type A sorting domain-containing protein [Candidatus Latescibacteria bacterium]|nr:T9SS type A sorting domain-containing protein [Candidatus Latescibacterota bacterium]NIO56733.1 T9SS type A sorting domain-containing protein [Candidatus Latescibacterota bacterium]NIT02318.1 T9SS type A sorting domain-containing protein [Candidatus Latescibacterota bacterium]
MEHAINGNISCFCLVNPPPEVPSNPSPADGSVNKPVTTQLSWESSDPENEPLTFDIYFGTDTNPPLMASDHSRNWYDPGILEFFTTYYWKIVAKDDKWNKTEGPIWSFRTQSSSSSRLIASSFFNYCGLASNDTVRIDLLIENSMIPIDAGGVDIAYDSTLLTFLSCEPGSLTANWQLLDCADLRTHVRVGGFDTIPIPPGSGGSFARLNFLSDCCSTDTTMSALLCPENPTDDFKTLWTVCGEFRCEVYTADGDANGDGNVSPGDALCAFEGYLSFPDAPASGCGTTGWDVRSDVDCNGQITPGDALCIFEHWLDGSCTFCGQSPAEPSQPLAAGQASVSIRDIQLDGSEIAAVVSVASVPNLEAFGFEVIYPADRLDYLGTARTELTRDFDRIGSAVLENGRLRLGGYSTEPVTAAEQTDLAELRFRMLSEALDGMLAIQSYVDDLQGAEEVTADLGGVGTKPVFSQYVLYQNYPNPFNPSTEIRYEIPNGVVNIRVKLSIFNIEGKPIRTLVDTKQGTGAYRVHWDGRNRMGEDVSSGVYFHVLQAGNRKLARKLVLVR